MPGKKYQAQSVRQISEASTPPTSKFVQRLFFRKRLFIDRYRQFQTLTTIDGSAMLQWSHWKNSELKKSTLVHDPLKFTI